MRLRLAKISQPTASRKVMFILAIFFRWGEALIQVSQPRSPCYKLNYHFDISDIAQLMQNTGKVGWLYSVIAPVVGIC